MLAYVPLDHLYALLFFTYLLAMFSGASLKETASTVDSGYVNPVSGQHREGHTFSDCKTSAQGNVVHETIHDGARQASDPWTVAVSSL